MSLERLLREVCGSAGALGFETTYAFFFFFFLFKKQNETKTTPQAKPQFLAGTRPLLLLCCLLLG